MQFEALVVVVVIVFVVILTFPLQVLFSEESRVNLEMIIRYYRVHIEKKVVKTAPMKVDSLMCFTFHFLCVCACPCCVCVLQLSVFNEQK